MVVLRSIFILNSVIIDSHMGLYWRFICHQKNHINQTQFSIVSIDSNGTEMKERMTNTSWPEGK